MKALQVVFAFDKSTKNTHRYMEQTAKDADPVVGMLYVQKKALGDNPPNTLKVTISTE